MPAAPGHVDFEGLLRLLVEGGVDFIIVGGFAASAHGAARVTYDLDIVYSREQANVDRLVNVLAGVSPYLRGAPAGLPFRWDAQTIERGLNFTLTTGLGDIDLLGEPEKRPIRREGGAVTAQVDGGVVRPRIGADVGKRHREIGEPLVQIGEHGADNARPLAGQRRGSLKRRNLDGGDAHGAVVRHARGAIVVEEEHLAGEGCEIGIDQPE